MYNCGCVAYTVREFHELLSMAPTLYWRLKVVTLVPLGWVKVKKLVTSTGTGAWLPELLVPELRKRDGSEKEKNIQTVARLVFFSCTNAGSLRRSGSNQIKSWRLLLCKSNSWFSLPEDVVWTKQIKSEVNCHGLGFCGIFWPNLVFIKLWSNLSFALAFLTLNAKPKWNLATPKTQVIEAVKQIFEKKGLKKCSD